MRILVTGARGFLGRTLLRRDATIDWVGCDLHASPVDTHAYHQLDLTDSAAVAALVQEVNPQWIINTAAITDVDLCERDPELARQVNIEAVRHLTQAAAAVDAGLIQLSTDYVFDGGDGPYDESAVPHPLSVYGQTKLESEGILLKNLERAVVVRTLWLYGYRPEARANFATWALGALSRGEEIRAFTDQWGNPTYVEDLARVLLALCRADVRGLFHMGGGTFLTRLELVTELATAFHLESSHIRGVATRKAGLSASRPLRSGLRTAKLEARLGLRPMSFREGLEDMKAQAEFQRDFAHLL